MSGPLDNVSSLIGPSLLMTGNSPVLEGENLQLTIEGTPGEIIRLLMSIDGIDPFYSPLVNNVFIPTQPWIPAKLGKIPASGQKVLNISLNELGFDVVSIYAQATLKDVTQVGTPNGELTEPISLTLLDRDTFSVDCNGNGIEDDLDITSGFSIDLNGNGIPDDCLEEGDCDGNGVSDLVDITLGALDLNRNSVLDSCESVAFLRVDDNAPNDPVPGDPDQSDPLEDGSNAHPFDSLQEAVDAAISGDVIVVANGLYTGAKNRDIDPGGRDLTIISEDGPRRCILDAENLGLSFVYRSGETSAGLIQGLTMRGSARVLPGSIFVFESAVTVRNCIFQDNPGRGIGMSKLSGTVLIEGCLFQRNLPPGTGAGQRGGGIRYLQTVSTGPTTTFRPIIRNCTFFRNGMALEGGAIFLDCAGNSDMRFPVEIQNCKFIENSAIDGGAIAARTSPLNISNSLFVRNLASESGGAVRTLTCVSLVRNSTFYENVCEALSGSSGDGGGAIYANRFASSHDSPIPYVFELSGCLLWNNDMLAPGTVGDQVFLGGTAHLIALNSLVLGGELDVGSIGFGGTPTVLWGSENLDTDPLFVDALNNDFHLSPGSPCIDAGVATFINLTNETDFDGESRLSGPALDIGVDEVQQ